MQRSRTVSEIVCRTMYAALRIRRALGTKLRRDQYEAVLIRKLGALGLHVQRDTSTLDGGKAMVSHLLVDKLVRVWIEATEPASCPQPAAERARPEATAGPLNLMIDFTAPTTSEMCRVDPPGVDALCDPHAKGTESESNESAYR